MSIPDNMNQITECALALIEKQDKMEQKKNYKTEQVKPQVLGQRVTFDKNGELIVLTNKGKIDAQGNQEVLLDGLFTINAKDVAKLLSIATALKLKEETYFRGSDGTVVTFFNPEKDVQDLIAENKELERQYCGATELAEDYKCMHLCAQQQITEFNRTRHFWERKLVLNSVEDNE